MQPNQPAVLNREQTTAEPKPEAILDQPTNQRIIAAIPNFNAADNVIRLAKQLLNENLDDIYILDDASTDNSLEQIYELGEAVKVIEGETNLGPAGNRNRILPALQPGDIIMFVDADMELASRQIRPVIEGLFASETHVAIVGGGIMNKKLKPMTYNYGLDVSPVKDKLGIYLERLAILLHFKILNWPLKMMARPFTNNLEIRFKTPFQQRVDWVSEGHCYIRASVFQAIGGFDGRMRYHEGKLLARRIRQEGWGVLFSPKIWTRHLQIHVRPQSEKQLRKTYDKALKDAKY